MYGRMEDACLRLLAPGSRASLVLADGKRGLNERFTGAILAGVADGAALRETDAADQRRRRITAPRRGWPTR